MAKPTVKQLTARALFAKRSRAGTLKKKVKSVVRRATEKLKSKRRTTKTSTMAGKSKGGGGKKSFVSKIPLINNPTFKKAALAAGTVSLAATGLTLIGQGRFANNPLLRLLLAFGVGGPVGAATQIIPLLQSGGLGSLLGGNGANGASAQGMA